MTYYNDLPADPFEEKDPTDAEKATFIWLFGELMSSGGAIMASMALGDITGTNTEPTSLTDIVTKDNFQLLDGKVSLVLDEKTRASLKTSLQFLRMIPLIKAFTNIIETSPSLATDLNIPEKNIESLSLLTPNIDTVEIDLTTVDAIIESLLKSNLSKSDLFSWAIGLKATRELDEGQSPQVMGFASQSPQSSDLEDYLLQLADSL